MGELPPFSPIRVSEGICERESTCSRWLGAIKKIPHFLFLKKFNIKLFHIEIDIIERDYKALLRSLTLYSQKEGL